MAKYSREVKVPGKSSQELYEKVSTDIERFLSKAPLGKTEIDRNPATKTVSVKSSMFSASLICQEGMIRVDGNLSLMALPFRGKLDEGIDKWLAKAFPV